MRASKLRPFIICLGNPGDEYRNTYHNIGQIAAAEVFEGIGLNSTVSWKKPPHKHFIFAQLDGYTVIFPTTFMNLSGTAVKEALAYFSISPDSISVFQDDFDLPLGEYRTTEDSGSAGHNGINSIIENIGTTAFHRVRIGIRPTLPAEAPQPKANDFVLRPIPSDAKNVLKTAFENIKRDLM